MELSIPNTTNAVDGHFEDLMDYLWIESTSLWIPF